MEVSWTDDRDKCGYGKSVPPSLNVEPTPSWAGQGEGAIVLGWCLWKRDRERGE